MTREFRTQLGTLRNQAGHAQSSAERERLLHRIVTLCEQNVDDEAEAEEALEPAYARLAEHLQKSGALDEARAVVTRHIARLTHQADELETSELKPRKRLAQRRELGERISQRWLAVAALDRARGRSDDEAAAYRGAIACLTGRDQRNALIIDLVGQLEAAPGPAEVHRFLVAACDESWLEADAQKRVADLVLAGRDQATARRLYGRAVAACADRIDGNGSIAAIVLRLAGLHAAEGDTDALRALYPVAVRAARAIGTPDRVSADDLTLAGMSALIALIPDAGAAFAAQAETDRADDDYGHLARIHQLLAEVEEGLDEDEDEDADEAATSDAADADLVLAAYFGDVARATKALVAGALPDARQAGTGQTALMLAVANQHVEIVRLLLEHGADPRDSVTVIADGVSHTVTPFDRARADGNDEILSLLRSRLRPSQSKLLERLDTAIRLGDVAAAREALAAGAELPRDRKFAEHVCSRLDPPNGRDLLEVLLAHGLDPEAIAYGEPLLFHAVRKRDEGLVELLLDRGASVNRRIGSDLACHDLLRFDTDPEGSRAVLRRLLAHGLAPDRQSCGRPLTHVLVGEGDAEGLGLVLDAGADTNLIFMDQSLAYRARFIRDPARRAAITTLLDEHTRLRTARAALLSILAARATDNEHRSDGTG